MEIRTKREIESLVAEFPLKIVEMADTKRAHIKVRVQHSSGQVRLVVFSSSPSDHRVTEQRRKIMRSIVRDLDGANRV